MGDGLTDDEEWRTTKTDPMNPDTDGDGLDDRLEILFQSDPLVANPDTRFGPEGAVGFTSFEQNAYFHSQTFFY